MEEKMLAQQMQGMEQWPSFSSEEKQFLLKQSGYLMAAVEAFGRDYNVDEGAVGPFVSSICQYLLDLENPVFKEAYCAAREVGSREAFYLERWLAVCCSANGINFRLRETCLLLKEYGADVQCFFDAVNGVADERLAGLLASITAEKGMKSVKAGMVPPVGMLKVMADYEEAIKTADRVVQSYCMMLQNSIFNMQTKIWCSVGEWRHELWPMVQTELKKRGFEVEPAGEDTFYVAPSVDAGRVEVEFNADVDEDVIADAAGMADTGAKVAALAEWVRSCYRPALYDKIKVETVKAIMDNYASADGCYIKKVQTKTDVYSSLFGLFRKKGYRLKDGDPYYVAWR